MPLAVVDLLKVAISSSWSTYLCNGCYCQILDLLSSHFKFHAIRMQQVIFKATEGLEAEWHNCHEYLHLWDQNVAEDRTWFLQYQSSTEIVLITPIGKVCFTRRRAVDNFKITLLVFIVTKCLWVLLLWSGGLPQTFRIHCVQELTRMHYVLSWTSATFCNNKIPDTWNSLWTSTNQFIIEEKRKMKVCDLTIQYEQFQFFPLFASCTHPTHPPFFFSYP